MNDRPDSRQPARPAGLCDSCRQAREVVSATGSRYVLCDVSRRDPRYPRYPRLPVVRCEGYDPAAVR